jgi:hypothetical protein
MSDDKVMTIQVERTTVRNIEFKIRVPKSVDDDMMADYLIQKLEEDEMVDEIHEMFSECDDCEIEEVFRYEDENGMGGHL